MSKFDQYDHYQDEDDIYSSAPKKSTPPTSYEDIDSNYTEKGNLNRGPSTDFTLNREKKERKFFDDAMLNRKISLDEAQRMEQQLRQQELEERRQAREAQTLIQSKNFTVNDFKSKTSRTPSRDDGWQVPPPNIYGNRQSSYRSNELEDTLEGIPLAGGYEGATGYENRSTQSRAVPQKARSRRRSREDDDASLAMSQENRRRGGGNPPKKKKKRLRNFLIFFLVLVLAGSGVGYAYMRDMFSGLNQTEISDLEKLGISDAIDKKYGKQNIVNFALFGIDTHEDESMEGHSDSLMIVSVNRNTGAVKIISVLRDSYVQIEGYGKDKITLAYSFGGPELAIQTLNKNFDMNIADYATVNFAKMGEIIDAVGGVDLEITEFERIYTNGIGQSTYGRKESVDLQQSGKVHMTGRQAVSFARIRADSDVNRAARQREVLNQLMLTIKSTNILKYPALLKKLMTFVETSMTFDEIMGFAPVALKNITIEQTTMPIEEVDKDLRGGNYGKVRAGVKDWVWVYDLEAAAERIHQFIYEDSTAQ